MKSVWTLVMLLLAVPAFAQQAYTPMPPDENVALPNTPVVTWDRFCRKLADHHPSSNVDYQPGVDVHGRQVASADLPRGADLNLPNSYRMFITSEQASKLGLDIPGTPLATDALIGEVLVGLDGRVTFNGEPIQNEQVIAICGDL